MNDTLLMDEIELEEVIELMDEQFTLLLERMKDTTEELRKQYPQPHRRGKEYKSKYISKK